MTNMIKDYYKILGVSETSTQLEIKKAYRKLARMWHPDIAGNSTENLFKFKEINEAYEILSDKTKKDNYDSSRRFYNYSSAPKSNNGNTKSNTSEHEFKKAESPKKSFTDDTKSGFKFNWEEFLSKYKEYSQKKNNYESNKKHTEAKKGKDIHTDVELTVTEAVLGTTKIINMIHTQTCSKCNGRKFVNGGLCSLCHGSGEQSDYKRFTIKIPAGIKNGAKIRLSEEGENGLNGGKNGDLYVTVHIKTPLDYSVDGLNVLKKVVLAPYEAVLGTNVSIKTPNGNVNVKITENTQNGQKIRLSGCGLMKNNKCGDMILTVEIQIPTKLSPKEIDLYKQLKELSTSTVK